MPMLTVPGVSVERPSDTSGGVRVLEIHSQGYGVQLVFSDGHQRGIYPWAYLAQMEPPAGAASD